MTGACLRPQPESCFAAFLSKGGGGGLSTLEGTPKFSFVICSDFYFGGTAKLLGGAACFSIGLAQLPMFFTDAQPVAIISFFRPKREPKTVIYFASLGGLAPWREKNRNTPKRAFYCNGTEGGAHHLHRICIESIFGLLGSSGPPFICGDCLPALCCGYGQGNGDYYFPNGFIVRI